MRLPVVLILAGLLVPAAGAAQAPAGAEPPESARAEVVRVIDRLFDAMRSGDSAEVRAVFDERARLLTVVENADEARLREESLDAFVAAVGTEREEVWDERLHGLEVRIDGRLASAWMGYSFFVGDRFSHCGVNAVQLFRGADGWRITQITDTRRREGCDPHADP